MNILVCGAGGFIGGHLVASLLDRGHDVVAVDIKAIPEWYQVSHVINMSVDLRERNSVRTVMRAYGPFDNVYNLAADMGGIGYIESHKAACMLSSAINANLLQELGKNTRYFYASSACVYNASHQDQTDCAPLAEWMAYPAEPEDGYGWEKLFSERLCQNFTEDYGTYTRVARFHNVYGPYGAFEGGREKAPAAICRKVAEAYMSDAGEIVIWGDGNQTRSFMYIDDCVKGIQLIANGHYTHPLNLGSSELVTVNQLVDIVEKIAGRRMPLRRTYQLDAPQGVRGRNSDNTLIRQEYGWEPEIPLVVGLEKTYKDIYDRVAKRY